MLSKDIGVQNDIFRKASSAGRLNHSSDLLPGNQTSEFCSAGCPSCPSGLTTGELPCSSSNGIKPA
ncbi:unnamed protein product, partial [Protopolystoma xenopodis]